MQVRMVILEVVQVTLPKRSLIQGPSDPPIALCVQSSDPLIQVGEGEASFNTLFLILSYTSSQTMQLSDIPQRGLDVGMDAFGAPPELLTL